jgi:SpoVK/Ycf46/Vps4 family AAA+-type ATPase
MSKQVVEERNGMKLLLGFLTEDSKDKPISDVDKQQIIQSGLSNLITTPFLDQHKLNAHDIEIIALLLDNFLKGHDGLKTTEVLKSLTKSIGTMPKLLRRILNLQRLGLLQTEERHSEADNNLAVLLHSEFQISDDLLNRIFNDVDAEQKPVLPVAPYKDNYEYLSDQFERLQIIENIVDIKSQRYGRRKYESDNADQQEGELKKLESSIAKRLKKTQKVFPFEKLKAKKRLSEREELIVLGLLYSEQQNNKPHHHDDPMAVINDLSRNQYEKFLNMKLCQKGGVLDKKGLLEIHSDSPRQSDDFIKLKDEIRCKLLGEKKQVKSKKDNFFELIKPSVALDNVVLTPPTSEELSLIIEAIQGGVYQRLKELEIKGYNLIQYNTDGNKNKHHGMNLLFYGSPGTGKTLAAHALAHKLGKDVLTFDCSRILSMWVGGSEQNTRMIFDRYRMMAKGMKNPPVLLLNEADQFLYKRLTHALRAVDQSYNQTQNIFLEQMERFDGILIATTNLVENLDTAFSRRFHHKIEFKRPGAEERLKLWHIHLSEKAPLAGNVDLKLLADNYALSGGQIAVVVQNASVKAAIKGDKIYQEDFISACEDEMKGNFDEKAKARMGF